MKKRPVYGTDSYESEQFGADPNKTQNLVNLNVFSCWALVVVYWYNDCLSGLLMKPTVQQLVFSYLSCTVTDNELVICNK